MDVSELVPVNEAAARLQRTYAWTKDLVLRGKLGGVAIGGRWYVVRSSLEEVLAARQANGNGKVPA